LDILLLAIVFLTPFSVTLHNYDFGVALSFPTEPLLFAVMLIYILRLFYEGKIERKIFFHPVTITILINIIWIFFTCITSSFPLVSWKFFLARLWLVIPFYFVALQMFRSRQGQREFGAGKIPANELNIKRHLWLYILSFSIIIIYTLINHAMRDFSEEAAHTAMNPFYNDHTSYGAMLAMYIFPLVFFVFDKPASPSGENQSRTVKYFAFFLLILFIIGFIFSYTRAAWLSMLGAMVVLVIYLLRIRLIPLLALLGVLLVFFFVYEKDIMIWIESGRHKNIKNRSIEDRLQSITNITTDPSNAERFNRWASAIRMFREKPVFGWGPGTYQFKYAPFQISTEKTIISTNFGERGNAHSEYLGPLAESGLLGMLSMLGIVITTLITAGKLIYHSPNKKTRLLAMAISLGLITYFIHGALNNFLDTDKASAPFWGFIAMLVAMDVGERE
jgi:O-antigen ligase